MVTIVIISNDAHVLLLKERFQPLITAQICIFSDFEQGLAAVFDKRPAAVFIQREIGGTTAEVIAKQIKGLLRDASPRIVLMGDLVGQKGDRPHCFDDSFDFASSEEELCAFFGTQLKKIPRLLWKEGDGPSDWGGVTPEVIPVHQKQSTVGAPDVTRPDLCVKSPEPAVDRVVPVMSHAVEPPLASGPDRERPARPLPAPAGDAGKPRATAARPVPLPQPPVSSESAPNGAAPTQRPRPAPQGARTPAAANRPHPHPASTQHLEEQAEELPPFEILFGQKPRQHSQPRLVAAAVLGVLILGLGVFGAAHLPVVQSLFRTSPTPAQQQPAAPAVPAVMENLTAQQPAQRASLPRLIPSDGQDVAYSKTHPGWERFFSPGMEFRVFRSGSDIKAVQVIAAGEKGIGEEVVAGLLQELLGSGTYSATSTARKQDYLVQQATLANGAELALYRKSDGGGIRGVVVTLP